MIDRPHAGASVVAQDLLDYLEKHPNNADTKEGICRWWILRQRLEECMVLVENTLDDLVLEGKIQRIDFNGRTVYSLAQAESSDA